MQQVEPSGPDGTEFSGEPTGEPAVDQALQRLARLTEAPIAEHVAGYEEIHRLLQDALADLDGD